MTTSSDTSERCAVIPHDPHARRRETSTWRVVVLTGVTMLVELFTGWWTGSLALLADGWHMGTHVLALGLAGLAYWYARTHARDETYGFGTGKVGALAGYTSAVILGAVAIGVGLEAIDRVLYPIEVDYGVALPVAVVGLVVNLVSALLLREQHVHGLDEIEGGHHEHHHDHHHDHRHGHDVNHAAAYMHVLADALTSVLAIVSLSLGRWLDWRLADPLMALVGGGLILYWAVGLLRQGARVLLDVVPKPGMTALVRERLERFDGTRVLDLHVWPIGGGHVACIATIATPDDPDPTRFRAAILALDAVHHVTVEVRGYSAGTSSNPGSSSKSNTTMTGGPS